MDMLAILSGIKGKVLDAHNFDLLKRVYDLQNENIEQLKSNNEALKEKNGLLEEKAALLKKDNESLKATIETLKSRLAALPNAGELSEDEKRILVFLSSRGQAPTDEMIAAGLGLNLTKTKFYLERMWDKYVYSFDYSNDCPSHYHLHQGGRAYLVENGLIK